MRGDIKKEVREEVKKEVQEEVKKEVREEIKKEVTEAVKKAGEEGIRKFKKVYHLLAKGMSDEEILKAIPEVTDEFVKDARESYEEDHQLSKQ